MWNGGTGACGKTNNNKKEVGARCDKINTEVYQPHGIPIGKCETMYF